MSIETVTARIADIRSTIAALDAGVVPGAVSGTSATAASALTGSAALGVGGADFDSQLAALTGATTGAGTSGASGSAGTGATDGDDVVVDAKKYLGVRYVWGGTDPATGLDCSGLVQRVFADLGVRLPRTVAGQKDAGSAVSSMKDARPGDLLVFGNHHIGIYVGDGKMLHAPKTGDVVKIAPVYDTPSRIRRVLPAGGDGAMAPGVVAAARPAALRAVSSGPSITASSYDQLFAAATARYDLPAGLLKSVARAESGLDPDARSSAGAIGLMQLMPGTARELGVNPRDPAQAIDGAARLLSRHLTTFGSVPLALAAYNAGPSAVRKHGGVPPFAETRAYISRVQHLMSGKAA